MGGLKKYFEDMLMKKLLGQQWDNKTFTLPSPIDQNTIDRYISEIEREMDSAFSTKNKVKKAVKKFGKEKFSYDDAGKRTFGNGLNFEQYKKNRHVLLKIAEDEVRRILSFREAINAIPIKDDVRRNMFNNLSNRWVSRLMKTDGSQESREFNKEAVALLALGNGLMTNEEFVEMRTDYYKTSQNMSQEDAEKAAKKENLNAPVRLMQMCDDVVEDAKKKLVPEQMEYDAYDIVTGRKFGQHEPNLDDKMANFWNPGLYLMWDTHDILVNDLQHMNGFQMTEEQIKDKVRENEDYTGILQKFQIEIEKSANPYFTVLDSYKTAANYAEADVPWGRADGRPKTLSQELYLNFLDAPENYNAIGMDCFKPIREYYAFNEEDIVSEIPRDFEFVVYHNSKNGYTAISRMKHMEDSKIVSRDDEITPDACIQEYANKNIRPERDGFIREFSKWNKKKRTSGAFERMRDAMNALSGVEVSKKPTVEELARIKDLYRELQAATDAYLAKKDADKERNHGRYTGRYEKKRVEFAQKLKKFADNRYKRISNAKGYLDTLELEKIKREELADNKEWKKDDKYKDLNVLQYLDVKRQEEEAGKRAEQERLEREKEKREKELEEERLLESGKGLKEKIDSLKSGIQKPDQNKDSAMSKIEEFIKNHEDRRAREQDVDQQVEESKLALAGLTIKLMMRWEHDPNKNPEPASFTVSELVNAGKIDDLVEIVNSQPKFQELVRYEGSLIKDSWFKAQMVTPNASWSIAREMMSSLKLAEKDAKIQNENVREVIANGNDMANDAKAPDRNSKAANEEQNVRVEKNKEQQFRRSMTLVELVSMGKKKKDVKSADKPRKSITVNKTKTLTDIQPHKKP